MASASEIKVRVQICPECKGEASGWPDEWRNKPGRKGLLYVCPACVVKALDEMKGGANG